MPRHNDGTVLDVRTLRIPQATTEQLLQLYKAALEVRGLVVVGEVVADIQTELFSEYLEVTFKARLAHKEVNV